MENGLLFKYTASITDMETLSTTPDKMVQKVKHGSPKMKCITKDECQEF